MALYCTCSVMKNITESPAIISLHGTRIQTACNEQKINKRNVKGEDYLVS